MDWPTPDRVGCMAIYQQGQPLTRADRDLVESIVHSFEAVVVQAIRLYTLSSSDLDAQRAVLFAPITLCLITTALSYSVSFGSWTTTLAIQTMLAETFQFLSAVSLNAAGVKQQQLAVADLLTLTDSIVASTHRLGVDRLVK
jgi:hypothetical protein